MSGAMDNFKQYLETTGVKNYLKSFHQDKVINSWADSASDRIKQTFPDDPNGIKLALVGHVLLPFCEELLKDVPNGWTQATTLAGM